MNIETKENMEDVCNHCLEMAVDTLDPEKLYNCVKAAMDITDRLIENEKIEFDQKLEKEKLKENNSNKKKELYTNIAIATLPVVLVETIKAIVLFKQTRTVLKFEETGTFMSSPGKGLGAFFRH